MTWLKEINGVRKLNGQILFDDIQDSQAQKAINEAKVSYKLFLDKRNDELIHSEKQTDEKEWEEFWTLNMNVSKTGSECKGCINEEGIVLTEEWGNDLKTGCVLLRKYLDVLLNSQLISNDLKGDCKSKDLIIMALSLLNFAQINGQFTKKMLNAYMKKFDLLMIKDKNYGFTHFQFTQGYEFLDEINYIKIFLKNNYQFDIETQNLEELDKMSITQETQKEDKDIASHVYKHLFHDLGDDISRKGIIHELIHKTRAAENLKREISQNSIYIYMSKPKWNPIIQKTLSCFLLVSIFLYCCFFGLNIAKQSTDDQQLLTKGLMFLSFTSFYGFIFLKIISGLQNDNFKYTFSKQIMFYSFGFFVLFSFVVHQTYEPLKSTTLTQMFENWQHGIQACLVILIVFLMLLFLLMYSVSFFVLNPQKNMKLIKSKINNCHT